MVMIRVGSERDALVTAGPWRKQAAAAVLGGLLLLVQACAAPADRSGTMSEAGALEPFEQVAVGPVPSAGPQVELFRPIDLAMVGDSIYVVDNGNDHVVVLNRALEPLGVLGREGEGPGEYQQPVLVRRTARGVIIGDMGNSRFTEIDRAGAVLRTFPAPAGLQSFAVTDTGGVVIPSRDGTHHFTVVHGETTAERGQWPEDGAAREDAEARFAFEGGFREPRVAVTAGDTVHVLDEEEAILYKYSLTGERRLVRSVPVALRDARKASVQEMVGGLAKQGMEVLASPLSRGLWTMPDGRLLLIMPAGDTFALLIDPGTYAAQRIVMPADPALRPIFSGARAAVVEDSLLYLLRDISIQAFRLRPAG
jgi:hypothetical protein